MAKRKAYFHVAPRYTAGSPAMVPEDIARRVAVEETRFMRYVLDGMYGDAAAEQAFRVGLSGIVEQRTERRNGWEVVDLCTGLTFFRPFPK